MWILIIFIILLVVGGIGYIKYPPFHDLISRVLTPAQGKVSPQRIEKLKNILEVEMSKTEDLTAKAKKAEADRKLAQETLTAILDERKKQNEALQKIKGK